MIDASDIGRLLANRHFKDVFVGECKNGPTWTATRLRKLDAWAMRRSWANFCTWGYEIKVARQDFLRDDKWRDYLGLCHQFYFVAPPGLIDPKELPAEAGLLVSSKNATRLYTKKKAPLRDIELPTELLIYILMCRSAIVDECRPRSGLEYWSDWLEQRKDKQDIGHRASHRIRQLVNEKIDRTQCENHALKRENEKLADVKRVLSDLGLRVHEWDLEEKIKKQISSGCQHDLIDALELLDRQTAAVREELGVKAKEGE